MTAATGLRLDIGAGTDPHGEGWTTVDAFTGADIVAEMSRLPLDDGSVDEIWSSHALEHVALADVAPTLREWRRVLRPGGTAVIQVPNLDYAARFWLEHPRDPWALQLLFGNQKHPGEFHRTGWCAATFTDALEAAGLRVDRLETVWDYGQETLRAELHRE